MSDKSCPPPSGAPRKPAAHPPAKGKSGVDRATLKSAKGPGPKAPNPGKRMALPGKARGR